MKKQLVFDDIVLESFEIIYSDKIRYGKDETNTAVKVELNIKGKIFTHTAYMWQWQVSEYLNKFGADI